MKDTFNFPMRRYECVLGFLYIPVHAVLLFLLIPFLSAQFFPDLAAPFQVLICFTVSFAFVVVFLHRFLKSSFSDLLDGFWRAIQAIILGYVLNYSLLIIINALSLRFLPGVNPNNDAFLNSLKINYNVMLVVSAVLAPIVEETLFRGILFGVLRKKSRIAAYIVSTLLFSVYHLWQFAVAFSDWSVLLYGIQYIPASIALAWCYERGGTIWSPIILHSAANLIAATLFRI